MQTVEYRPRKYLSISTLIQFLRCPRRYFYQKCGISPGVGHELEPPAPTFGTAMHTAVPVALVTQDETKALEAFDSIYELYAEEYEEIKGPLPKNKTRQVGHRCLKHFVHTRKDGKCLYTLIDPADKMPHVEADKNSDFEVAFLTDIGLKVPLGGRWDGLCLHRVTDFEYIWELKTTGRLTSGFLEAHEFHLQNLAYMAVALIHSLDIKGVMLEAMLTDPKKVDNKTQPLEFTEKQVEDGLKCIQRAGKDLLDMEERLLNGATVDDAFPKNFTGCSPYAHYYIPTFPCEYMNLCKPDDWQKMLPFYHVRPDHDFIKVTTEGE